MKEIWTATAGDLSQRREPIATPETTTGPEAAVPIVVDPTRRYQYWEGAGAALTDSSAYLFMTAMDADQRHRILTELFDPAQAGLSTLRISMGSCDFSSQRYYSYDDLPEGVMSDSGMTYFSIGQGKPGSPEATKDMKYVVPVLQEIMAINPGVRILASPWSAPAWMKDSGRLDGAGRLRLGQYCGNGYRPQDTVDAAYARYFVRFIEAYQKLGIPIAAVTMQNEPSNNPPWPMTLWTPEELVRWGVDYLRPALDRSFPEVEIFFGDDGLRFFSRPVSDYMTPVEAQSFAGTAMHTYSGLPKWVVNATRQFPGWRSVMSERRCMLDEQVDEASHVMFGEIGIGLVRQGVGMIDLWNLALDEQGLPSWARTMGRRGVITIDSQTGGVKRNLEYFMLRNFGQDVPVGARRVASTSYTRDGRTGGLGSVAFVRDDGELSAILYNPTGQPIRAALTVNGWGASWRPVSVPAFGTVSCHVSDSDRLNHSTVPEDDQFVVHMTPHPADDHDEGEDDQG